METIFVLLPLALIAAVVVGFFIWAAMSGSVRRPDTPAVRIFSMMRRRQPSRRQIGPHPQGEFTNDRQEQPFRAAVAVIVLVDGDAWLRLQQRAHGLSYGNRIGSQSQARLHGRRPSCRPNDKWAKQRWRLRDSVCVYCHDALQAVVIDFSPSTAVCINCHSTVGLNKEWVLRMKEHWDRGEPIPWVKVHDLPDFVYFDHSAHLNAKNEKGEPKLPVVDEQGS